MPKILILESCIVNLGTDDGGVIAEAGALVSVNAPQALGLVNIGRALYTVKGDDPSKGLKTASADVVAAAEAFAKSKAKAAAEAPSDKAGEDKAPA